MVAKFVLLPVVVAVVAIINTSTAESNESISNPGFGYELTVAGLEAININMQQNNFRSHELNSKIESLEKMVQRIETLVTKQFRHVSILEEEITKCLHPAETTLPETCADISDRPSGMYRIQPQVGFSDPFEVYCDQEYEGGGWLVIQNRHDGSVDFFRGWKEYEVGFGDLRGEFWLGLKKIHEITYAKPHELRIILEDFDGKVATAQYDRFTVGGAETKYVLRSLGNHTGTARDSLRNSAGMKFTTFDNDNDEWGDGNCADRCKGAWWYNNCVYSNLNGLYSGGSQRNTGYVTIMCWNYIRFCISLKRSRMMIRVVNKV